MYNIILMILSTYCLVKFGLQLCPEEVTKRGVIVTWPESPPRNYVRSNPPCYNYNKEVTRHCVGTKWIPDTSDLKPCLHDVQFYNLSTCPPGFHRISRNSNEYCYQVGIPSKWDYPCLKGGGATVITDLSNEDLLSLIYSLSRNSTNRYYWLPAQRTRTFNPIVWYVPGSNWGRPVETNNMLRMLTSILKNCLLLDIESMTLSAVACNLEYPSLCFYINNVYYTGKCPKNYHAVKYNLDYGMCFGIEYSSKNLSFEDFNQRRCKNPLGHANINDKTRFIFKKIAETDDLSDNTWCWFAKILFNYTNIYLNTFNIEKNETFDFSNSLDLYVSINNIGTISLMLPDSLLALSCMACQTEVVYEKTELVFEYSERKKKILLTIYNPSGLWKYDDSDIGIQCFSDANGFIKVVDVQHQAIIDINDRDIYALSEAINEVKTMYTVNLVTNRSAQYWCEGHTNDFTLLSTEKVVVNPTGNVHVFVLVLKILNLSDVFQIKIIDYITLDTALKKLCSNIEYIFNADKVLVMEALEYSSDDLTILLHLHVAIDFFLEENNNNVSLLFDLLKYKAETELPKYNYIFINLSSAVYCLPTTSIDIAMFLDWGLTPISHVVAPKQFCLQQNGLPVNRLCDGSYLYGGFWGEIQGTCDQNYLPSDTTTFLYKFVKGLTPQNNTFRFLIDGLEFALSNIDIIIPADIYYLSVSLLHVLYLSAENNTAVDIGNIENIAWAMNRIMVLNEDYLRLSQTLNSTNVILDAVNKIIEIIAYTNRYNFKIYNKDSNVYKATFQQVIEPLYIVQISYPKINNISGIAVCRKSGSDLFTDMDIRPLYRNTSLNKILALENLEIATWLPDSVLDVLQQNTNKSEDEIVHDNEFHLIINVFFNDSVFQELHSNTYKVNSRIVGISLPGFISNLQEPIPLIYKELKYSALDKTCGYWDFHASENSRTGHWSNQGCYLKYSMNNLTLCECYHFTHFGQLINVGSSDKYHSKHVKSLNIISLVGSFLSLLGIAGIWTTASVFYKWRKKPGTKVLLHLSGSIALPLLYIVVLNLGTSIFESYDEGNTNSGNKINVICIIFGALLHYFVLVSFMWMLITAVLQYIRYVRVLGVYRPSRFMIKLTFIGWGIPTIPVIIVLTINKYNYIPETLLTDEHLTPICYPNGFYLLLGVVLPICVVLFVNIILYVLVLRSISQGPDGKMRKTDIDLIGAQFRLSIFLFFLLGFTWIFGLLSFTNHHIWSYLFCLTSTLQGFILFIYFIIFDPDTRNLWVSLMKPQITLNKPRESVTSISSG